MAGLRARWAERWGNMIIVDRALQERAEPIRVGVVGAGFAARGFVAQVSKSTPGMEVVAIANRTLENAETAFVEAGAGVPRRVDDLDGLAEAISSRTPAITDDPKLLCATEHVEAIVEATGEIVSGSEASVAAIDSRKHLVLMNAELDATLGPILKVRADDAGVVMSDIDGDQPGVLMNLIRTVNTLGFEPLLAGNIKSLLDHRRTPETQKGFAERVFQRPKHITSFADGTKISMEMAVVANATGFGVGRRGMYGPACTHVEEAAGLFDPDELRQEPLVDYILGAEPSFGVFVLGFSEDPIKQRYMSIYKMGDGPLYTFYTPFHLSPLEAPMTVARAVLFGDATVAPQGAPVCDVVAIAKRDLEAGETLDGIGGFTCYGTIDNSPTCRSEGLLPMGLTDGCVLTRDVEVDAPLTFEDVAMPEGRLCDSLWNEQAAYWMRTR